MKSLELFICEIMSSAKKNNLTSACPIWMPLFLSLCLIGVVRSGKSELPCLVPDLRGKAFNYSLFSILAEVCHI
jgi:hypothetical protein